MRSWIVIGVLVVGCRAPTDERATLDGSVAHPRCESCHVSDFEAANDPPHDGELPTTCFVCHTQTAWAPALLAHDFYPLTGAHEQARCFGCHRNATDDNAPRFEGTPSTCVDCHRADYGRSTFPGHDRFALTCGDCHATAAWTPTLHPPPELALDAGAWGGAEVISGASQRGGVEPPPLPPIEHDAGPRHRTPRHHTPPPPSTTTTTPPHDDPPPDVHTRPSMRREPGPEASGLDL